MATQLQTEQPSRSAADQEKRTEAVNWDTHMRCALEELGGLLTAALCVIRFEEDYTDTSEEEKKQALATLMEYSRGAVADAKEGHEQLWRVTAGYIYGTKRDAPDAGSDPEHPAPSAPPTQTDQPA